MMLTSAARSHYDLDPSFPGTTADTHIRAANGRRSTTRYRRLNSLNFICWKSERRPRKLGDFSINGFSTLARKVEKNRSSDRWWRVHCVRVRKHDGSMLATFQSDSRSIFNRRDEKLFLFSSSNSFSSFKMRFLRETWEITKERTYGPSRFKNAVVGIDPVRVQTHRRRDNELRYISVFFIFVSRLAHAPLACHRHDCKSSSFLFFPPFPPSRNKPSAFSCTIQYCLVYQWSNRSRV